ncbi:MAG: MlaD family protein [Leptolyngbyaceae bacterium]|nr:MlaD family protein [Leptolyngbyaceae bacterium]
MRPRTFREGSVGLLILLGLGIFGILILWIRGLNLGSRSYQIRVAFDNVAGMLPGAPVRYRGVGVGRILSVDTSANAANVLLEINSADLVIPSDSIVEANQIGLVGETSIDITPLTTLSDQALAINPLSQDCDSSLIICHRDTLQGTVGVSYDTLIRTTAKLAQRFDDPEIVAEIRELVSNSADAAAEVAELSREVTELADVLEEDLGLLAESAVTTVDSVTVAASQFGLTAEQLNTILAGNRDTIANTLDNLNQASFEVQRLVGGLAPTIENGELTSNLETLAENAARASENIRAISDIAGQGDSLLRIQETLDSAYETFDNLRKITADLDELTGDPQFRRNVRDLVNGLSNLVSTTQQLENQTAIAWGFHRAIAIASAPPSSVSPSSAPPLTSSVRTREADASYGVSDVGLPDASRPEPSPPERSTSGTDEQDPMPSP